MPGEYDHSTKERYIHAVMRVLRGESFGYLLVFIGGLCLLSVCALHARINFHEVSTDDWFFAVPPVSGPLAGRASEALNLVEQVFGPHANSTTALFLEAMYGTHTGRVVENWLETGNWSDRNAVEDDRKDLIPKADTQAITKEDGSKYGEVYGEILSWSLLQVLANPIFNLSPGKKFYDLGSGHGRAVMLAGLLGLESRGIEFEEHRHDFGCRMIDSLKEVLSTPTGHGRIELLHASFRNFDFSDADMVFCNSITWNIDMMQDIARTAAMMREGAVIIVSDLTAKPFDKDSRFSLLGDMPLAGSWLRPHLPSEYWPVYRVYQLVKPTGEVPQLPPLVAKKPMGQCHVDL